MLRVRVTVSGWVGGPGLQTFYFTDASETNTEAGHCVVRVRSALVAAQTIFPTSVVLQVQPTVDVIDPITGNITATLDGGVAAPVPGTGGSASILPPATAFVIRLQTATYNAGRRLQGRLFLSPLVAGFADPSGKPAPSTLGLGQAMSDILNDTGSTSPLPVIWRRPRKANPLATPPVTARAGSTGRIMSGSVKPTFGVLRSRRD